MGALVYYEPDSDYASELALPKIDTTTYQIYCDRCGSFNLRVQPKFIGTISRLIGFLLMIYAIVILELSFSALVSSFVLGILGILLYFGPGWGSKDSSLSGLKWRDYKCISCGKKYNGSRFNLSNTHNYDYVALRDAGVFSTCLKVFDYGADKVPKGVIFNRSSLPNAANQQPRQDIKNIKRPKEKEWNPWLRFGVSCLIGYLLIVLLLYLLTQRLWIE